MNFEMWKYMKNGLFVLAHEMNNVVSEPTPIHSHESTYYNIFIPLLSYIMQKPKSSSPTIMSYLSSILHI